MPCTRRPDLSSGVVPGPEKVPGITAAGRSWILLLLTLRSKETRLVTKDSWVMAGLDVEKTLGPEAIKQPLQR